MSNTIIKASRPPPKQELCLQRCWDDQRCASNADLGDRNALLDLSIIDEVAHEFRRMFCMVAAQGARPGQCCVALHGFRTERARKQNGKSSDAFLVASAAKHPQLARQMPLADTISNASFSARMSHVACRITNAPGSTTFKSSLSKWPSELLAMQHVVSQPAQVRMSIRPRIDTTNTICVSGRR